MWQIPDINLYVTVMYQKSNGTKIKFWFIHVTVFPTCELIDCINTEFDILCSLTIWEGTPQSFHKPIQFCWVSYVATFFVSYTWVCLIPSIFNFSMKVTKVQWYIHSCFVFTSHVFFQLYFVFSSKESFRAPNLYDAQV